MSDSGESALRFNCNFCEKSAIALIGDQKKLLSCEDHLNNEHKNEVNEVNETLSLIKEIERCSSTLTYALEFLKPDQVQRVLGYQDGLSDAG